VSDVLDLAPLQIAGERESVLRGLGLRAGVAVPDRGEQLVQRARELYAALAEPRGIYGEISTSEFEAIYRGEGRNAHRTPLAGIFPRAARMALFAATLGAAVSERITALFEQNEPALGYALDAIASERADAAAELLGRRFLEDLLAAGSVPDGTCVLAYSPGYCGWDITGQRRLFARLQPQRIGITLNASCLMQPLKSVSGVLVAGPAEIHDFDNDYDFCDDCATFQCRERIASLA